MLGTFVWLDIYEDSTLVNAAAKSVGYRIGYSFVFFILGWCFSAISLLWFACTNALCNCRIYVAYFGAR